MKRLLLFIVVFLAVIALIYSNPVEKKVEVIDESIEEVPMNYESTDITVMLEEGMDTKLITEVKDAASYYPQAVLTQFNDSGWKVMIVSEIDYTDSGLEADPEDVGLTNYKTKTIQVLDIGITGAVRITLLHELAHYADLYYGYASSSDEFNVEWEEYKNSYVEFGMQDEEEDSDTKSKYATFSKQEMFACGLKDYLYNSDYLWEQYPHMAMYYKKLMEVEYEKQV